MLQKVVNIRPNAARTPKLLTRAELDAYDPASESWQPSLQRRYTHHRRTGRHPERHVENVNDTVYGKFAICGDAVHGAVDGP
jgi:lysine 2,3-aminomutase